MLKLSLFSKIFVFVTFLSLSQNAVAAAGKCADLRATAGADKISMASDVLPSALNRRPKRRLWLIIGTHRWLTLLTAEELAALNDGVVVASGDGRPYVINRDVLPEPVTVDGFTNYGLAVESLQAFRMSHEDNQRSRSP